MCKATQPTETRGCPEAGTKRTLALLQLSSELDGILTPQSCKYFQSHTTVLMPPMCQSRNGHLGTGCWCLNIDGRRHTAFLQHPSGLQRLPFQARSCSLLQQHRLWRGSLPPPGAGPGWLQRRSSGPALSLMHARTEPRLLAG